MLLELTFYVGQSEVIWRSYRSLSDFSLQSNFDVQDHLFNLVCAICAFWSSSIAVFSHQTCTLCLKIGDTCCSRQKIWERPWRLTPPLSLLLRLFLHFSPEKPPPHSYRELFSPRVPLFHCVPTKLNGISLSTLFWLWLIVWDMIFRSSSWGKVDQGGRSKVSDTKFNGSEYLEPDCSTFVCTKLITIWLLHHTQLCEIFYIGWHADRKVNENGY